MSTDLFSRAESSGRPLANEAFVKELERILRRPIARRAPGRKKRVEPQEDLPLGNRYRVGRFDGVGFDGVDYSIPFVVSRRRILRILILDSWLAAAFGELVSCRRIPPIMFT